MKTTRIQTLSSPDLSTSSFRHIPIRLLRSIVSLLGLLGLGVGRLGSLELLDLGFKGLDLLREQLLLVLGFRSGLGLGLELSNLGLELLVVLNIRVSI